MAKLRVRMASPAGRDGSADSLAPGVSEKSRRDPRWRLMVTPAMQYQLMTGEAPTVRLPGWVTSAQGQFDEATVWRLHGAAMTQVAADHGFEPYALKRRKPTGPAFEAWRTKFLATHGY